MGISNSQEKIVMFAEKIQNNKFLKTLSVSMVGLMAMLMAGALFSLIRGLPLGGRYADFLTSSGLGALLEAGVNVCQLMGLFVVLSISYHIAKDKGQDAFTSGLIGLISFLLVTPLATTAVTEAGEVIDVTSVISLNWLGAQGMFSAILVGFLSGSLYCWLKEKKIRIKMPEQVPEFVAVPFEGILTGMIIGTVFLVIRGLFELTSYGNLHAFIYGIIQMPLMKLGANLPAMIILIMLCNLLWWFGIHGTIVTGTVVQLLYMPQAMENLNTFMAGGTITPSAATILTALFWYTFINYFGGAGFIGLGINMVAFAKSERYKAVGRLSFVPLCFNIIEPVVFGFPIVMNPIMFIPVVFVPGILATISYFLMLSGTVGMPIVMLTVMTLPGPIAGFLLGGGISLGILVIVLTLVATVLFFPFFKICDRQALAEEQQKIKLDESAGVSYE